MDHGLKILFRRNDFSSILSSMGVTHTEYNFSSVCFLLTSSLEKGTPYIFRVGSGQVI